MYITISEGGRLLISPKTHLESFALQQWIKSFEKNNGCTLAVESFNHEEVFDFQHKTEKPTIPEKAAPIKEDPKESSRMSGNGKYIPSEDELLFVISQNKKGCSVPDIAEALKDRSKRGVYSEAIYPKLNKMVSAGRLIRNTAKKPMVYLIDETYNPLKNTPKTVDEALYANDKDRINFAKQIGFSTIDEAINKIGSWKFESELKDYIDSKNT